MSVVRSLILSCNGDDCTVRFHGTEGVFTDAPIRNEARAEGWTHVSSADGGKDYCPDHDTTVGVPG